MAELPSQSDPGETLLRLVKARLEVATMLITATPVWRLHLLDLYDRLAALEHALQGGKHRKPTQGGHDA